MTVDLCRTRIFYEFSVSVKNFYDGLFDVFVSCSKNFYIFKCSFTKKGHL